MFIVLRLDILFFLLRSDSIDAVLCAEAVVGFPLLDKGTDMFLVDVKTLRLYVWSVRTAAHGSFVVLKATPL